jgi:hypothetical protein
MSVARSQSVRIGRKAWFIMNLLFEDGSVAVAKCAPSGKFPFHALLN